MPKRLPKFLNCMLAVLAFQGCYLNDGGGGSATTTDEVSFSTDVTKIFTSKCTASGCHTGASPAGSLDLNVKDSDATTVFTAVKAEIDTKDPANSVLLLKSTNKTSHTGGAVISEGSDEYAHLLKWITDGGFNDDCTGVAHAFGANVTPIFSKCTNSGCHDTSTPILKTTPYDNITSNKEVNKDKPMQSPLLRKPLGLDAHPGGVVFTDVNDVDYKTIFCWIKVDAAANN